MIIMHFINFLCVCLVEGERRRRLLRGRLSTVASQKDRLGGEGGGGGKDIMRTGSGGTGSILNVNFLLSY